MLEVIDASVEGERIACQPSLGHEGAGKQLLRGIARPRRLPVECGSYHLWDVVPRGAVHGPQESARGE